MCEAGCPLRGVGTIADHALGDPGRVRAQFRRRRASAVVAGKVEHELVAAAFSSRDIARARERGEHGDVQTQCSGEAGLPERRVPLASLTVVGRVILTQNQVE